MTSTWGGFQVAINSSGKYPDEDLLKATKKVTQTIGIALNVMEKGSAVSKS